MSEGEEFNLYRPEPLLIVISGPSGVGKDTVIQCMMERGLPFHFVVTATTRPPRPEERHGVDYFFLTKDEFAEMIDQDELLEYAIVYNDYKGIPKQQVRQALGQRQGCGHARGRPGRGHHPQAVPRGGADLPDHPRRR